MVLYHLIKTSSIFAFVLALLWVLNHLYLEIPACAHQLVGNFAFGLFEQHNGRTLNIWSSNQNRVRILCRAEGNWESGENSL